MLTTLTTRATLADSPSKLRTFLKSPEMENLKNTKIGKRTTTECCCGKFENLHSLKLLYRHGSRLTNWVGIISQGLRIAPPEAPKTGKEDEVFC